MVIYRNSTPEKYFHYKWIKTGSKTRRVLNMRTKIAATTTIVRSTRGQQSERKQRKKELCGWAAARRSYRNPKTLV
ncbi:hypothetical protein Y032_0081g1445 [Ancylostoma ceylanicum]|uniref:Uncharacterized protein n=1 Tax=Ancylostoma ceylanicum TaxID=53326 RepID=A0A016TSI1_9BILA|nr:hypothetical protein Y032_0081g1445 [Ancylostoma ceylanicum]